MIFIYILLAWLLWILGMPLVKAILGMSGSLNKEKVSIIPHRAVIIWGIICLVISGTLFYLPSCTSAGDDPYRTEIEQLREEINHEFADSASSPLATKDLAHFDGLNFYAPDKKYRVEAQFLRNPDPQPFEMQTTTERRPVYVKYGEAHFVLDGQAHILEIYQSDKAKTIQEFSEYLFLPFKDLTNGNETYGGGRYIDLKVPRGNTIIIDFNKAYNPYCAYNNRYSCPVPPRVNHLNIAIPAGVKTYDH